MCCFFVFSFKLGARASKFEVRLIALLVRMCDSQEDLYSKHAVAMSSVFDYDEHGDNVDTVQEVCCNFHAHNAHARNTRAQEHLYRKHAIAMRFVFDYDEHGDTVDTVQEVCCNFCRQCTQNAHARTHHTCAQEHLYSKHAIQWVLFSVSTSMVIMLTLCQEVCCNFHAHTTHMRSKRTSIVAIRLLINYFF